MCSESENNSSSVFWVHTTKETSKNSPKFQISAFLRIQTLGQVTFQGALYINFHGFSFRNVIKNENLKNDPNHHFFWQYDLDLWPMTLKTSSSYANITINVCAKLENNPSSSAFELSWSPHLYSNRRQDNGRQGASTSNHSIPQSFR